VPFRLAAVGLDSIQEALGAFFLPLPIQAQDTLTGKFVDSVVVRSPLPGPLVPIVQWIFQRPGWVMAGGIILGGIVGVVLLVWLWRRRGAIWAWLVGRNRAIKLSLAAAVIAVLAAAAVSGLTTYNFMMHDNRFCQGCHIFVPSGQVFVKPDTGTYLLVNRLEGKHDTLSCHACHPFEIVAQSKELFYWIVERPDKVPPHAKVPRRICESCHVSGAAKKTWERIATTAGHRTHLESDSSALSKVECLTCHARSAHRFQPADTTCAQKGCHLTDSIRIRLGRMAARFDPANKEPLPNEEQLYCNSCHQFTAEAQFVSHDSATGKLTPGSRQCFGCHEMRTLLATFDPGKDPHSGSCGMCHNPHTDAKPKDALKSCAAAQCHADWRDVAFHVGAAHRQVAERCQTCHAPHSARVDASDCTGCHEAARKGKGRLHPPIPFDTTKALRQTSLETEPPRSHGRGDVLPSVDPPGRPITAAALPSDTFSHPRHRKLACITCHSTSSRKSDLTFEPPRGCQICHHQRAASSKCATCHEPAELAPPEVVTVSVAVPRKPARSREVPFLHESHAKVACIDCHTAKVSLSPEPPVATCAACHDKHHTTGVDCASCHRTADIVKAHAPPLDAHQACDECHTERTIAMLQPTRSFCLACHDTATDHYRDKECTVCHLQATPESYRARLTSTGKWP
jgi:hypothetical protein